MDIYIMMGRGVTAMDKVSDEQQGFVHEAGDWYDLPVDRSLNQIHRELKQEYPANTYSRNLIRNAIKNLASSDRKNHSNISIYNEIFCRRNEPWGIADGIDTHPVAIEWEVVEFVKAITRAKAFFGKKQISAETLAEKALEYLMQDLLDYTERDAESDFRKYQVLKEPYTQDHLISQYEDELTRRLDLIFRLTIRQPASIAVHTLRRALPALDNLIIDLTQEPLAAQEQPAPLALDAMLNLYQNLRSVRFSMVHELEDKTIQFHFSLHQKTELVDNLKKQFRDEHQEIFDVQLKNLSDEERKQMEKGYNQYLCAFVAENEPNAVDQIKTFLKSYDDVRTYIQRHLSVADLHQTVLDELTSYACDIFRDAERCDCLPYSYSMYQADSASTAFVTERTKYAHDQIRAAIHEPLRLLQIHAYMKFFRLDYVPDLAMVVFSLIEPLEQWREAVERSLQALQENHPELSLTLGIPDASIEEFIEQYTSLAIPIFKENAFPQDQVKCMLQSLCSNISYMEAIDLVAQILKANCQLVVSYIIKSAADEIVGQYQALLMLENR